MTELLLELFSEEIPARMQLTAAGDLKRLVTDGMKAAGLEFSKAEAYVTPRRLALVVDGLPDAQPDVSEERRGPKVDAPEKAIQGFLGSIGMTLDQCEQRETPKGTFWFVTIEKKGRPASEVLQEIVSDAINKLPWPKSMRWGAHKSKWVRPLHSIVCLFGGEVIDVVYGPVTSGKTTRGHRFMAPDAFEVSGFGDYVAKLKDAKVILDTAERRHIILETAHKLAAAEGLTIKEDDKLATEVAGLVEWPVVLIGTIDDEFMDVPHEVLTLSMATHQKYFSTLDKDGNLANRFVLVANREGSDGGKAIAAGNERVLRARLSDCKFFWDQDRKVTLESRVPALEEIVFHAKLGSVAEKVERVAGLAAELCQYIPNSNPEAAKRAAKLAKADLVSDMVYELPEVQGVMGRYYALHDGEALDVAEAVAEHYSPLGPGDDCPTAPISVAVAMADKLDTLAGFWSIDEKPTGSKDPFALRRAALGVIRLVLENNLHLPLLQVFGLALKGFQPKGGEAESLLDFFADRLKVHLKEQGVRHDLITAVFALGGEDDLVRLLARVEALGEFLGSEDGANLLAASKRASNILRIEEKKDGVSYDGEVKLDVLSQDEEKVLVERLMEVGARNATALADEDFVGAMSELAKLRAPVDAFFDKVTVNSDNGDERANRLRILANIRTALGGVADFSKIEG